MAILSSSPLQYLASIPPATRVIASLLVLFPAAFAWLRMREYKPEPFMLVLPGETLWHPWTLVTAAFVETDLLAWMFSFITVLTSSRYLERLWGTMELVKFFLVVVVLSNAVAVLVSWIEFALLGMDTFLFTLSYQGMSAYQTAVLVAFMQLLPEHQVQIFGFIKIRVKRVPMAYVTISTILCLAGYQSPWIIIQFGWLVSWTYLRFYKKNGAESGDNYGDRSETFAFTTFFPPLIHGPITILSNGVYSVAVRLRLVRTFASASTDLEGGHTNAPGGARAEAERRRAMALKALDQRVASNATASATSGPSSAAPHAPSSGQGSADIPARVSPPREEAQKEPLTAPTSEHDAKGKGKAVAPTAESGP